MKPEDFCRWLQGYLEIAKPISIDEIATQEIKNHLQLVFTKVTPNVPSITLSQGVVPKSTYSCSCGSCLSCTLTTAVC